LLNTARRKRRFGHFADDRDFDHVCRVLEQLGSRWLPPSRTALVAVLTAVQM
jgi:hypothetical protein